MTCWFASPFVQKSVLPKVVEDAVMSPMKIPVISDESWLLCANPDLGPLGNAQPALQDVVDHHVYQGPDGRWRLWAAIRNAGVGHLIYGWVGSSLTGGPWLPDGVKLRAEQAFGERREGETEELACAPFFILHEGRWQCLFNTMVGLHLLESKDGLTFARALNAQGQSLIQRSGRDPMVLRWNGLYLLYSCVTTVSADGWAKSSVIVRRSNNLRDWSDYTIVAEGGLAGNGPVSAESPFVHVHEGVYYLFRSSSSDFMTYVYASNNPLHFGVNDDSKLVAVLPLKAPEIVTHEGVSYISDLADFKGIRLRRLTWS